MLASLDRTREAADEDNIVQLTDFVSRNWTLATVSSKAL